MSNSPRKLLHASVAVLVVASLAASEEIADYRHESMEAIGGHFQSVLKIVRGDVPFESHLSMHADALADYGEIMASLFEEGSEGGEALDKIWDEPEEFGEVVENFKDATAEFKEVVDNGGDEGEVSTAFRAVGAACKGCHDSYRE